MARSAPATTTTCPAAAPGSCCAECPARPARCCRSGPIPAPRGRPCANWLSKWPRGCYLNSTFVLLRVMAMWDPGKYLMFDDHRSRPFDELVARIRAESPRRVVDLGCGPGHLTETLAKRWPTAALEAFDSSPEMVAAARERGLPASVADVRDWHPAPGTR